MPIIYFIVGKDGLLQGIYIRSKSSQNKHKGNQNYSCFIANKTIFMFHVVGIYVLMT